MNERTARELLDKMEADRWDRGKTGADGYVYVVFDDADGELVNVVGPFDSPGEALLASETQKEDDRRNYPDGPMWTHRIAPIFTPKGST